MKTHFSLLIFLLIFNSWNNINAQIITLFAGNGTQGYSGDGGLATEAQMQYPDGVWEDSYGNVYIGDRTRIRKVDAITGIITTFAGNSAWAYNGDSIPALDAQFSTAYDICFDPEGNLIFSDLVNNRVRKINMSTGIVTTIAGTGSPFFFGDGGLATEAGLYYPSGLSYDTYGNLYIVDRFHDRIRKVDTSGIITTVAGTGVSGYSGDGGIAIEAQLNSPTGVVTDSENNFYITDFYNSCIRKVNITTGIISTYAGNGTDGYSGDGDSAINAQLNKPIHSFIDDENNLYISDNANYALRKVDAITGIISTIAGREENIYLSQNCASVSAPFTSIEDVFVNNNGVIYITDNENSVIWKIDQSETTAEGSLQKLDAGDMFSVAICSDSTVSAWGLNDHGILGDTSNYYSLEQVQVPNLSNIVSIATKNNHVLALKNDGTVWTWGFNLYGQLGIGTVDTSGCFCNPTPSQVLGLTDVIDIACGSLHSMALKSDGTVWTWGYNYDGQLGDGTNNNSLIPVQAQGISCVVDIVAGGECSYALKENGTVWSWGNNSYGQMGTWSNSNSNIPRHNFLLSDVIAIESGWAHAIVLQKNGTVKTWGLNYNGQLGYGSSGTMDNNNIPKTVPGLNNITNIACGANHTLAMSADGSLIAWGDNTYYQLGDGTSIQHDIPEVVGSISGGFVQMVANRHNLLLKNDGIITVWGANFYGELGDSTVVPSSLRKDIVTCTVPHTPPSAPSVINGNSGICIGSVNEYSISSVLYASDYSWTLPAGWSGSSNGTSILVTPNEFSGVISVTANNSYGTSPAATFSITVFNSPETPSFTQNGSLLTCSVSATEYQWHYNGTIISEANSITYIATEYGNYQVEITDLNGCTSISEAILVQLPPATPSSIIGNVNVCVDSENIYSINPINGADNYTWTLPSGWLGSSTDTSITVIADSTSGNISVTANNAIGSSAPQIIAVTGNPPPDAPSITASGNLLNCNVTANSYQWYLNDNIIANSISINHYATTVGFYQVEITDINGCIVKSDSLYVKPSDIFEITWNNKKLITMYPNPVKNELIIETEMYKNTTAEISNIDGQIIQYINFNSTKTIINTENFAKGIYLIKIKNDLGIGVRKFTKE
ncbi:MAG TPA: hypothetical protein DDX39_09050 [Bacteroidales bacterium]|nr:MAG: hypothetical protein A2W98_06145 [Bacteroidetes bacterium GWF2_33_38]HBF88775.1 hypothetical protein [Bacteroidales bacterium]